MKLIAIIITFASPLLFGAPPGKGGGGQGMPAEAREKIHALFEGHSKLRRDVKKTESGYTALTESDDPEIAKALKQHVKQMSERLESGLMVRRWDPAFAEYVEHYAEIEHRFEPTEKGVRTTVNGKTPDAIRIAQNHAEIISAFVGNGWKEHDKTHAPVKPEQAQKK